MKLEKDSRRNVVSRMPNLPRMDKGDFFVITIYIYIMYIYKYIYDIYIYIYVCIYTYVYIYKDYY